MTCGAVGGERCFEGSCRAFAGCQPPEATFDWVSAGGKQRRKHQRTTNDARAYQGRRCSQWSTQLPEPKGNQKNKVPEKKALTDSHFSSLASARSSKCDKSPGAFIFGFRSQVDELWKNDDAIGEVVQATWPKDSQGDPRPQWDLDQKKRTMVEPAIGFAKARIAS